MKKIIPFLILGKVLVAQELLPTIVVNSETLKKKTSLDQHLTSQEIEDIVSSNKDIPSLLKTNPNVKVIEDKTDPSSIEPAKIEINEAKYYQNAFILDGLSADSLLDPNSYNRVDDVEGNENELFLDLDLIDRISVYDSAISAEYGSFSGGVIDVKLKNPSATPSGKVSYRLTGDSFTKIHEPKESNTYSTKPKFDKKSLNTTYSGPINEDSGFIFSYSYKEGTRPKEYLNSFKNIKNKSSNYLFKYTRYFEDAALGDLSLIYSPYEKQNIKDKYTKDSYYTTKGGGITFNGHYEKNFDKWELDSNISIKSSKNERTSDTSYLKNWLKTSTQDWGNGTQGSAISAEGSWGSITKTQESILSKIKLKRKFENHILNTGLELNYIQGNHERDDELIIYKEPILKTGIKCNGYLDDCIERQQYFQRRDIYQQENVDANMFSSAFYLEDEYKYKNLQIRLGLRTDYNDYLKNFDLAPRLKTELSFFDKKTRFFGGLNRYYAKSFLAFKLREARTPYRSEYRSSFNEQLNNPLANNAGINPSIWNTSADKGSDIYLFSELETPYTDEKLLGFSQSLGNSIFKFKFLNREAKKQFTLNRGERRAFTRPDGEISYYHPKIATNNGESSSDIYTLTIQNLETIKLFSSFLNYSLSYSHADTITNFKTYDTDDESSPFFVRYNGKTVAYDEIQNYDRPGRYILNLNFKTPSVEMFKLKGSLNTNFLFTYTPSHTKPEKIGTEEVDGIDDLVEAYEDTNVKALKNLDVKFSFDTRFGNSNRIRISADFLNILDDVEEENSSYEIGRQYWLGMEYKF